MEGRVVVSDTGEPIATHEAAELAERYGYPKGDRWVPYDELPNDWPLPEREEPEFRLRIKPDRGAVRWVEDFHVSRLLWFDLTVEGRTKHYREMVDCQLRLSPSLVAKATKQLRG